MTLVSILAGLIFTASIASAITIPTAKNSWTDTGLDVAENQTIRVTNVGGSLRRSELLGAPATDEFGDPYLWEFATGGNSHMDLFGNFYRADGEQWLHQEPVATVPLVWDPNFGNAAFHTFVGFVDHDGNAVFTSGIDQGVWFDFNPQPGDPVFDFDSSVAGRLYMAYVDDQYADNTETMDFEVEIAPEPDFTYSYENVLQPEADDYIVATENAQVTNEGLVSYWHPIQSGILATITQRFEFAFPTTRVFIRTRLASFNFGASVSGGGSFWASKDGENWELLLDAPTTENMGEYYSYANNLPVSLLGATVIYTQARLLTSESNIMAQWSRDTDNVVATVFEITADLGEIIQPSITSQPEGGTVDWGRGWTFSVTATGTPPLSYQWHKDGVDLVGANSASLTLPVVMPSDSGVYSVTVSNAGGVRDSVGATLNVDQEATPAVVAQPESRSVDSLSTVILSVGASGPGPFSYQWRLDDVDIPGATSAELVLSNIQVFNAGSYTVAVTNAYGTTISGAGVVAVAVPPSSGAHLLNISTRGYVGSGASVLIPGLVISDHGPMTVLLRAIGPSLKQFLGEGELPDPILVVYDASGTEIYRNDDWGANPAAATTTEIMELVHAFNLPVDSKDAAIVLTLPPGIYTVHAIGKDGGTGIALVEVYEVP